MKKTKRNIAIVTVLLFVCAAVYSVSYTHLTLPTICSV